MPSPTRKTGHIGIVACSAEGAALCYRTICTQAPEQLGPYVHPEGSMHTPSFSEYVECLERDDWQGVGQIMLRSAEKLAGAGADFFICPDNTIHRALPYVEPHSPRPWLHIAQVVAEEARSRGFTTLGLTGTHWTVEGDVYPQALAAHGLRLARPTDAERDEIHRIIMDELVYGIFKNESIAYVSHAIDRMNGRGCDAVILGCTELPLIINDANSPLPPLDSTRLLALAAVRRAASSN